MSLHLHADTTISCSEGDTVNKVERSFPAPSLLLFVYLSITLMLGQSLIRATAASSMNLVLLIYHVCTKLNRVRQNACIFTQNVIINIFAHNNCHLAASNCSTLSPASKAKCPHWKWPRKPFTGFIHCQWRNGQIASFNLLIISASSRCFHATDQQFWLLAS